MNSGLHWSSAAFFPSEGLNQKPQWSFCIEEPGRAPDVGMHEHVGTTHQDDNSDRFFNNHKKN